MDIVTFDHARELFRVMLTYPEYDNRKLAELLEISEEEVEMIRNSEAWGEIIVAYQRQCLNDLRSQILTGMGTVVAKLNELIEKGDMQAITQYINLFKATMKQVDKQKPRSPGRIADFMVIGDVQLGPAPEDFNDGGYDDAILGEVIE